MTATPPSRYAGVVIPAPRKDRRPRSGSLRDASGAAYVEFLLAFVPIFTLFLGIVQLSLLFGARLLVEHAAFRAARSAAVVIDDDPRYYADELRGSVVGRDVMLDDVRHRLSQMGIGIRSGEIGADESLDRPLSRRATVELAAALVLLPLSHQSGLSVDSAIGSDGLDASARDVIRRTNVRFLASADGSTETVSYAHDGEVTVEVRYRYECSVPVARALVCPTGDREIRARRTFPVHGMAIEYADFP